MARNRWSHGPSLREKDVNWAAVYARQQERLRLAERDPLVLVYVVCHNPVSVKCETERAVFPLLSTLVHATHHLRKVYNGKVGTPVFVGRTDCGTAVYEVHTMYRLSDAETLTIGWDRLDAHYAQRCEWTESSRSHAPVADYEYVSDPRQWSSDLQALVQTMAERFAA